MEFRVIAEEIEAESAAQRRRAERLWADGDRTAHDEHLKLAALLQRATEALDSLGKPSVSPDGHLEQEKGDDSKRRDLFSLDRTDDLPKDLAAELNRHRSKNDEAHLEELSLEAGEPLQVQHFIAAFYRRHQKRLKHDQMARKIYRMVQKGKLYVPEGRRGWYDHSTRRR